MSSFAFWDFGFCIVDLGFWISTIKPDQITVFFFLFFVWISHFCGILGEICAVFRNGFWIMDFGFEYFGF